MDFGQVKQIKIVEVLARYSIQLKYRGDWANALCPLPTHKPGDKERKFAVNIPGNYWKCWSGTCNANNGGKQGGDVISLVAALEGIKPFEAATKLVEWFGTPNGNPAPKKPERKEVDLGGNLPETITKDMPYMAQVEQWWAKLRKLQDGENDGEYEKRVLNGIKAKMLESYRNGKKVQTPA